jgi:hypothetical protein
MMHLLESIGLKESIIIIAVFSGLVILVDELLHARRRKRREAERQQGH